MGFFLYWTARSIFVECGSRKVDLLDKIYYLNRTMNSVDLYYKIDLPRMFFPQHPMGSILGRAVYGSRLTFYQGCTVGQSRSGCPVIGDHVILFFWLQGIGKLSVRWLCHCFRKYLSFGCCRPFQDPCFRTAKRLHVQSHWWTVLFSIIPVSWGFWWVCPEVWPWVLK